MTAPHAARAPAVKPLNKESVSCESSRVKELCKSQDVDVPDSGGHGAVAFPFAQLARLFSLLPPVVITKE